MSWAKKKPSVKNIVQPTDQINKSATNKSRVNKPKREKPKGEKCYIYNINGVERIMTRKEVWDSLVYTISCNAPSLSPLIFLPMQEVTAKGQVYCNGSCISVTDKFWLQPYSNMVYNLLFELVHIVLGHRVEKEIIITEQVNNVQDTLRRRLILRQIATIENIICHSVLLYAPSTVGIKSDIIKPTDNLRRSIYKTFGTYNISKDEVKMYYDDQKKLTKFIQDWSNEFSTSHYETIAQESRKSFKRNNGRTYSNIVYEVSPKAKESAVISRFRRAQIETSPYTMFISMEQIEKMRDEIIREFEEENERRIQEMLKNKSEDQHSIQPPQPNPQPQTDSQPNSQPQTDSQPNPQPSDHNPQPTNPQSSDPQSSDPQNDNPEALLFDTSQSTLGNSANKDNTNKILSDKELEEIEKNLGDYPQCVQDLMQKLRGICEKSEGQLLKEFMEENDIKHEMIDLLPDVEQDVISEIIDSFTDEQYEAFDNQLEEVQELEQKLIEEISNQVTQQPQPTTSQPTTQQPTSQSTDQQPTTTSQPINQQPLNSPTMTQQQMNNFLSSLDSSAILDLFESFDDQLDPTKLSNLLNQIMNEETDENNNIISDELKESLLENLDKPENDEIKEIFKDSEDDDLLDVEDSVDFYQNNNNLTSIESREIDKLSQMTEEVYKNIMIDVKHLNDTNPIYSENGNSSSRIQAQYDSHYKVSSLWWKKAQKMIMGYVPDVNSSYRRPNKKFAMSEFIIPSQCEASEESEVDRLRVYLDSSGSMTDEDFVIFKSIIKSSQKYFPNNTEAYEFNNSVKPMQCVRGKIIGTPSTTGGTSIRCVVNHINSQPFRSKTLNIIVTDGGFNWNTLLSYMTDKDRQSKFMFILTRSDNNGADIVKTKVNRKRLQIIYIESVDNNLKALKWG